MRPSCERFFAPESPRLADFERRGSVVVGDVHPDVAEVAGALTPVPGGVGPLTIAMLLKNTVAAAQGAPRSPDACCCAALTGGIATGKSYCIARFAALGVPGHRCRSCSRATRSRPGRPASRRSSTGSAPRSCSADGTLDRAALGPHRVRRRAARAPISKSIVHPDVYRRIREWLVESARRQTRLAIADIPLLFETGTRPRLRQGHRVCLRAGRADPPADGREIA